jgi:hypothetical protein
MNWYRKSINKTAPELASRLQVLVAASPMHNIQSSTASNAASGNKPTSRSASQACCHTAAPVSTKWPDGCARTPYKYARDVYVKVRIKAAEFAGINPTAEGYTSRAASWQRMGFPAGWEKMPIWQEKTP